MRYQAINIFKFILGFGRGLSVEKLLNIKYNLKGV